MLKFKATSWDSMFLTPFCFRLKNKYLQGITTKQAVTALFRGFELNEYHTKCYGPMMNIVDTLIIYKMSLMTQGRGGRDVVVNRHF
jgi:hypothetical protein